LTQLHQLHPPLNAYTFSFDDDALAGIREAYNVCLNTALNAPENNHIFNGGQEVKGDIDNGPYSFYTVSYGSAPLLWLSSNNDHTYGLFKQYFDALDITEGVKELVDYDKEIVMYCGFFVIGNQLAEEVWHVDYFAGANAYTLITPLFPLDEGHGDLFYRDENGAVNTYRYKLDEAIIFGDHFSHTTQPYAKTASLRVLLSLTFGTDKIEHWPILGKTIGAQSQYLILPCGHRNGTCTCLEPPGDGLIFT